MNTNKEVADWYNDFSENQNKTGINLRHYSVMDFLINEGLSKKSKVLEIGCGIGTLTQLIQKFVKNGHIHAVDISPESVEMAKKKMTGAKNISFSVSDMSNFSMDEKFDIVVLPDVMEHIPVEQHENLFKVIENHLEDNGKICIHIPHPKALNYNRENYPEKLQIIDQSLDASVLISAAYKHNLLLEQYEAYSLFDNQFDYVKVVFSKDKEVELSPLSKMEIIKKKQTLKAKFNLKKI